MAPMVLGTPSAGSTHLTGEPEKPSAIPVVSTAGPLTETRL
jgi:hypothetical protein